MNISINKDTEIYCSFSQIAGNKGCKLFNHLFQKYKINAIYKSFSVENIDQSIAAAKYLKFCGCAVSMPFKKKILELIDIKDESCIRSNSANTLKFDYSSNVISGFNTDFYGVKKILLPFKKKYDKIVILGDGGLSGAVQAVSNDIGFGFDIISRKNWYLLGSIKKSLIYNCTPVTGLVPDKSNFFVDCIIGTETGDLLHKYQAHKQFEIYTGIKINDV